MILNVQIELQRVSNLVEVLKTFRPSIVFEGVIRLEPKHFVDSVDETSTNGVDPAGGSKNENST